MGMKTDDAIRAKEAGTMLRKVTDFSDAKRLKELIAPSVYNPISSGSLISDTVYASPAPALCLGGGRQARRHPRYRARRAGCRAAPAYRGGSSGTAAGVSRAKMVKGVIEEGLQALYSETDQESVDFYRASGFAVTSLGEKHPGIERFSCRWEAA